MHETTLAERFNDVSRLLTAEGLKVVVQKARALLEGGESDRALGFLEEARATVGGLDVLTEGLRDFISRGGSVTALVLEPAWLQGAAREQLEGRLVSQAWGRTGLDGLLDSLVEQARGAAAKEPLGGSRVQLGKLPPLPGRGPVAPEPKQPELSDDLDMDVEVGQETLVAGALPEPDALAWDVEPSWEAPVEAAAPAVVETPEAPAVPGVAPVAPVERPAGVPPMKAPPEKSDRSSMLAVAALAALLAAAALIYFVFL